MSESTSFYWFDYETFGTHPAWDRPCQFAGVRTDMDLNEIDDPMVIYCKQSPDYLPNPVACKVTGITPQLVNKQGLSEATFIERIVEQIGKPGTCSLGYNSIRFDDEFTRHTLFRNFFEPYEHEYKDGNSRWDLLDIVRLTRALRPEGIQWPPDGNRLENLTAKNGIEHGHAHDALSDVRATISMARLIKQKQPLLFKYAFDNRSRQAVSEQLRTTDPQVSLLVSGMIPFSRSHITPVLPLTADPKNRNSVIVIDLHQDPSELLDMSADEIAQRVFTKQAPLVDMDRAASDDQNKAATGAGVGPRPGLRTVQINKCPVVVPFNRTYAEALGIDLKTLKDYEKSARLLLEPDMLDKIVVAMTRAWPEGNTDAEGSLYGGPFLKPHDRKRASELRESDPASIEQVAEHFDDKRLVELAWRYQARNFPDSLDAEQQARWLQHCHARLTDTAAPWLSFDEFDEEMANTDWHETDPSLRQALQDYRDELEERVGTELSVS